MKALVYTAPNTVEYRDEPAPVQTDGESLVQIEAAGICGSDLHAYLGHDSRRVPPLILGHEVCGTVVEGELSGQTVVLNPLITCGKCNVCLDGRTNLCADRELIGMNRPGAFADYISIPTNNLIQVPADANSTHLALTEPAATALHAIRLADRAAARPTSESNALVVGSGSVGMFCVLFLKDYGCKNVTLYETNALRRETAESTETCKVLDPTKIDKEYGCYDLVIDAVGNQITRETSINAVRPGGVVMHIGLGSATGGLDARTLTLSEITFIGTYTYTALDLKTAARKIYSAEIGPLDWADERPMSDGAGAFQELISGLVSSPKIILHPHLS